MRRPLLVLPGGPLLLMRMLRRSGMKLARNRTHNRQADDHNGKDTQCLGLIAHVHDMPRFDN